jgi:hypothetical protein
MILTTTMQLDRHSALLLPAPGAPLAYRAAEANAMAQEHSDDEVTTAQPIIRPRYLDGFFDDEADESR